MRVLWIVNNILPEAKALLEGSDVADHKGSGGWILGLANELVENGQVDLSVATVSKDVPSLTKLNGKSIHYYLLPFGRGNFDYNSDYEKFWLQIQKEVQPEIVDIHGSEFSHGLAYIKACGNKNIILTMQGVMQAIYDNYLAGLSNYEILNSYTFHDIIKGGLFADRKSCRLRAQMECEYLKNVKFVIGRTTFDRGYTQNRYPDICYFHCNEIMREVFYEGCWTYKDCTPYSIFLSQSATPIKGAHVLFKAVGLLIKIYPEINVYISGSHYVSNGKLHSFLTKDGYQRYLERLIHANDLEKHVFFLGTLSADEMKAQLLKSNIFVCPSSVENSSNSVSEAHLLGVPCVSSCVGGLPSIVTNSCCDYLYPFGDYVQLAARLEQVFEESREFDNNQMRTIARQVHDKVHNAKNLMKIYTKIINSEI